MLLQGCQMAHFRTKNFNLDKFLRVLQWKILVYYMAMWSILWLFNIFCGHLVYFMVIWYIFPVLVCCTTKNLATLCFCVYKFTCASSTLIRHFVPLIESGLPDGLFSTQKSIFW
jgi:hypothetical protein